MQTHVGMNTPVTGPNSFETSVQKFIAKGVDVQITEMDIGQDGQRYNSERLKAKYKEFFTMFLTNRKVDGKNGIRGVTLWGIIDERSWIYNNNGNLVYKQTAETISWTGHDNSGKKCPSGTYYYVVKSTNKDKRHNTAGFIQLFRQD